MGEYQKISEELTGPLRARGKETLAAKMHKVLQSVELEVGSAQDFVRMIGELIADGVTGESVGTPKTGSAEKSDVRGLGHALSRIYGLKAALAALNQDLLVRVQMLDGSVTLGSEPEEQRVG